MSKAMDDVICERIGQVSREGWTDEHDDQHCNGELGFAAVSYVIGRDQTIARGYKTNTRDRDAPYYSVEVAIDLWPWAEEWWKPKNPRRDLVRAAALLIAEIERIDRAAEKEPKK